MPLAHPVPLPLWRRVRLWLATPIVYRLALLGAAVLIAHGYAAILDPVGTVEQVTRQVVGGILKVTAGAGLLAMLTFWRD